MKLALLSVFCAGAFLLLWSAAEHVRRPGALRALLVGQRIIAYRWTRLVARALVTAEALLGVLGVLAVLGYVPPAGAVLAAAGIAALYATLGGYATVLLRRSPNAPCGCFGDTEPVSMAMVVRAGVLATGAAVLVFADHVAAQGIAAAALGVPLAVALRHAPAFAGRRQALAGAR